MTLPRHPTLRQRQLQARLKQLAPKRPVLAASLVVIRKHCGRPGCHCQSGPGHPGHYLTCKPDGKTRTVYVPRELLPEVKLWIREYKRIKTLLKQVSRLVLAQVQTHVRTQRRRAGRS